MTMANYCLTGDVSFTPVANANYILDGTFTPTYSAIWIEHEQNGTVMGNKIEIHGSAKINLINIFAKSQSNCGS